MMIEIVGDRISGCFENEAVSLADRLILRDAQGGQRWLAPLGALFDDDGKDLADPVAHLRLRSDPREVLDLLGKILVGDERVVSGGCFEEDAACGCAPLGDRLIERHSGAVGHPPCPRCHRRRCRRGMIGSAGRRLGLVADVGYARESSGLVRARREPILAQLTQCVVCVEF